uniref:Uncharacterized protein n=2 Tax=Opuntia streptacantha TaxID=393608 RepID=A0A7C8Z7M4_OPUST
MIPSFCFMSMFTALKLIFPGMNCTCWLLYFSTYLSCEIIFTDSSSVGHVLWWMVLKAPTSPFGVMLSPWTLMQCYVSFLFSVYPWFWFAVSLLFLFEVFMLTDVSECLCRFSLYHFTIFIDIVYVAANIRPVPGWHGWFSVAPVQVEQPEPLAPRCGQCWMQGSMMIYDYIETPFLCFLPLSWYLKAHPLWISFLLSWTIPCHFPFYGTSRVHILFQGFLHTIGAKWRPSPTLGQFFSPPVSIFHHQPERFLNLRAVGTQSTGSSAACWLLNSTC